MTTFNFLHAADIHLDSPLRGLSRQDITVWERVRAATREALDRLVGLAIEEKVDFLVIAGDLYDGDWPDYKTGLFFVMQMGRLNRASIPVYLLYGNHDAQSHITKRLELPGNVYVFDALKPESFSIGELEVAIHGQSFRQRDVTDNLVLNYPEPSPYFFNIGVLHTGLGGMSGHANYAPCSIHHLKNKGYDYWALGHIHKAEVLCEDPYIVFPGNLQGRHIRETGPKGARLVSVENGKIVKCAFMPCDLVRWLRLPAALDDARSMDGIFDRIRSRIESAVKAEADGRLLVCRVVLEGRTEFHSQIVVSEDEVLERARAVALGLGDGIAWVERIEIDTSPKLTGPPPGPILDLLKLLREAENSTDLMTQIQGDIEKLVQKLPYEVRTDAEEQLLNLATEKNYAALVNCMVPYAFARVSELEN